MRLILCLLLILSPTLLAVITSHHDSPQETPPAVVPQDPNLGPQNAIALPAAMSLSENQAAQKTLNHPAEANSVEPEIDTEPARFALNR